MNKDQVKGTIKKSTGKVQQKVGEVTGSKKEQIKGIEKQIEGDVQKVLGNTKENIKEAGKESAPARRPM